MKSARPNVRMPNFLIIGAEKCGTTSLYYYLRQHPEIYVCPVKETNFFLSEDEKNFEIIIRDKWRPEMIKESKWSMVHNCVVKKLEDYQYLFSGATNEIAIGEISPLYLYSNEAADDLPPKKWTQRRVGSSIIPAL